MSEFDLTIGKAYEKRRNNLCLAHLHSLGLVKKNLFGSFSGANANWVSANNPITSIPLLNLATVCLFTDHVTELIEKPADVLMGDEVLGNLPWWMDSLWSPVEFSRHKAFEDDSDGPFFFGSVPGLLSALKLVQSKSKIPLGIGPEAYELMRRDAATFNRSFDGLKDNTECIQWVWRGLFDAATIAQQNQQPILGNGL